jgi:leucyl aminopeptidase
MDVAATTESPLAAGADTIAIGVFEDEGVAHDLGDGILEALLDSGEARRKLGRVAVTHFDGKRVLLVGLGPREAFTVAGALDVAGSAAAKARELTARVLCWEVPHHVGDEIVAGLVEGTVLRDYRFERYREPSGDNARGLERLILSAHHDVAAPAHTGAVIAAAQNRARDLGNTAANDMTPIALADYAIEAASGIDGLTVTTMTEAEIREAGMGMFAAVAQGSTQEARLIRLQYDGAPGEAPRLALVGKAVTFDTGGISLKPAAKMHEMKFDMGGGAAVIGAIIALAELRVPISVLGVVGATENMPGGHAVKPGDIVTALDGTTAEINNTDAEGRLVLGDCLTYAIREGAEKIVDLATLTGGVVVALGSVYAGLMANDDAWAASVTQAAETAGEPVWRLPLHPDYAEAIKGRYGQITNLPEKREASSIVAAEFLHHFAKSVTWAHLDIAGTGYAVKRPFLADKGASGFGVRLLVELAQGLVAAG